MKLNKLNVLLLSVAVGMMMTACSKENEEPKTATGEYDQALVAEGENQPDPGNSEFPKTYPFGQVTVLMQNYRLNNYQVFFTSTSVDPYNPSIDDLIDCTSGPLSGGLVGCPLIFTQMQLPGLEIASSLYSDSDAEYPVILISARGGEMKVRCLPNEGCENFKTLLYNLSVPNENEGFRPMTPLEKEFFGYTYEEDGDWQVLDFPENRTDDFRVASMSIGGEYDYKGTHQDLGTSRTWFFVQLPWTDDMGIFDRVPLFTLEDLRK